jgi:hypothetical protein
VGLVETTRTGQLLSKIAGRTQNNGTQQVAKRPTTPIDHHCLLEAG